MEEFGRDRSRTDGLQQNCRGCRAARAAAEYAANPEKSKARVRAWRAAHPEKVKAQKATWYAANSEKEKARKAAYRSAHPEKVKAQQANYARSGTCADCGGPRDPRQTRCLPCANATRPGGTSWTTLARDPEWAWSPCNLYLVEIELERGPVLKVGIGTLDRPRNHKGDVLYRIPCPRVGAFYWEQMVLDEAGRDPVDPDQWTGDGGRTEVVADKDKALAIFRALAEDPWSLAEPNDEILEWFHDYLQGEHLHQLEESQS